MNGSGRCVLKDGNATPAIATLCVADGPTDSARQRRLDRSDEAPLFGSTAHAAMAQCSSGAGRLADSDRGAVGWDNARCSRRDQAVARWLSALAHQLIRGGESG